MTRSTALDDALAAAGRDHQAGRYKAAAQRYAQILAQAPDWVPALARYADLCERRGEPGRAHELWERAGARAPANATVQTNLAKLRRERGDAEGAIRAATAALTAAPDQSAARFNRALAARDAGRYETAAADLDLLLDAHPEQPAFLAERGRIALARHEPETAAALLSRARATGPADLDSAINLATAYNRLAQPELALALLDSVADAGSDYIDWHSQRGLALADLRRPDEAERSLAHALALGSRQVKTHLELARLQDKRAAGGEAEATLKAALGWVQNADIDDTTRRVDIARIYNFLGVIYHVRGRYRAARDLFSEALAWHPEPQADANYLLIIHYDPAETQESLYAAHRAWRDRQVADLDATSLRPPAGPADKTPLRLGILTKKLTDGPQTRLYVRAFEALDPARFELVVYDQSDLEGDTMTARCRAAAALWRSVADWDAAAIATQIRADGIDILINKTGHAEGKVETCAHRPAPVQIQWGGFNTTGLDSVDWFLADPVECPADAEPYFSETVYRLPDDYVVFAPPDDRLQPGPLPAPERGYVTFGCFNAAAKINAEIAALWARILAALPDSRLVLKRAAFDDPDARAEIGDFLAAHGIPGDRLDLCGWSSHGELLATYREIDIALDTWPYSGGLTTLEALWMGVPVVSLPGPSFVGRHAASHLTNSGNADWVVADGDAYVDRAIRWARDWAALGELRAELRGRLLASPVCDAERFADNLAGAIRHMWHNAPRDG